jgi:transcriptional repressor NrdR
MKCPKCGTLDDKVIDSRQSKDGLSIRRRRECLNCSFRFTTYEEVERVELRVVKRSGITEPFDREKLSSGIQKAFDKRGFTIKQVEDVVDDVIMALENRCEREVKSAYIGDVVMEKLHAVDDVAYLRYASVHRQFQEATEFVDEARQLAKRVKPSDLQPELFS